MRKRAWLRDIRFVFGEVESLLLDGLLALDGATDVFLSDLGGADPDQSDDIDVVFGDDGDDVIEGRGGADTLTGGNGTDTVAYTSSSVGVTVDLTVTVGQTSTGEASGDILSGFENAIGSAQGDTLRGTTDANVLQTTRAGVATGLVSVPNRYMHSAVETVSLDDADRAADLLAAFIRGLEGPIVWAP